MLEKLLKTDCRYVLEFHSDFSDIDTEKLGLLIKVAFGTSLVKGYFAQEPIKVVLLESFHRAAAIILPYQGWDYLDKFVVHPLLQTNGVGSEIFHQVMAVDKVFWRVDQRKPCLQWYFDKVPQYDLHSASAGKWILFWKGQSSAPTVLEYAEHKRETLEEV
ncbi:MAG: hypothetical protein V1837_03015 [Candidatus Woesearchaeota archaeon]